MLKNYGSSLLVVAAISFALVVPFEDVAAQGKQHDARQSSQSSGKGPSRASRKAPPRSVHYPPVGYQVRTMPNTYRNIRVNRYSYRYHDGIFYRPGASGIYVVVNAPIGARVGYLPPGYISFFIGPSRYFYLNYTYYLWDADRTEYIVVEEPAGAEPAVVAASETVSGEIFVYPNEGQSDELRDRDRYECYLWSVDQTSFDPGAANPEADNAGDYRRAISACLEGRGYTVK